MQNDSPIAKEEVCIYFGHPNVHFLPSSLTFYFDQSNDHYSSSLFSGLLDDTEETNVSNLYSDLYPDFSIPKNMQGSSLGVAILESLD